METLLAVFLVWVASVIAGGYVAAQKHRPVVEGVLFGVLFGPIGMLTMASLPTLERIEPVIKKEEPTEGWRIKPMSGYRGQ